MAVRVYELDEKEVHMIGTRVAVAWNVCEARKTVKVEGGEAEQIIRVRNSKPYIDFITIRKDEGTGKYYQDEQRPTDGGIGIEEASAIMQELWDAIVYLNRIEFTTGRTHA